MANLEEAILHRIPKGGKSRVLRNAEVQTAERGQRAGLRRRFVPHFEDSLAGTGDDQTAIPSAERLSTRVVRRLIVLPIAPSVGELVHVKLGEFSISAGAGLLPRR